MLVLVLLLFVSQPAHLSSADRADLAALRDAVTGLENGIIGPRQFERQVPKSHIQTWLRLQRRIPSTASGSANLALVLAYYGVDYDQNLRRLLDSYWRWMQHPRGRSSRTAQHDAVVVANLPADLGILHDKRHDLASLRALLDMDSGTRTGSTAEQMAGQASEVVARLWQQDDESVLRAAFGSQTRLWNVEQTLDWSFASKTGAQAACRELQRLSRRPDRRVSGAARQILRQMCH